MGGVEWRKTFEEAKKGLDKWRFIRYIENGKILRRCGLFMFSVMTQPKRAWVEWSPVEGLFRCVLRSFSVGQGVQRVARRMNYGRETLNLCLKGGEERKG